MDCLSSVYETRQGCGNVSSLCLVAISQMKASPTNDGFIHVVSDRGHFSTWPDLGAYGEALTSKKLRYELMTEGSALAPKKTLASMCKSWNLTSTVDGAMPTLQYILEIGRPV